MTKIVSMIKNVTPRVQELVDLEFAKLPSAPEPGSRLDQANLKNGDKVIYEYLDHGELGLAFDHLTYLIDETEIELTQQIQSTISVLSNLMTAR